MGRRHPFIFNNFYIFKIMKKNEIGNNRADSKKSVESKNCDELMTVPCVDTDIKPSSDDEGDCTSEVKFVRVSDLYSNYLKPI